MDTRHLVDPELLATLDSLVPVRLTREAMPGLRASRFELLQQQRAAWPSFPDIAATETTVPGRDGAPPVRVLQYLPKSTSGEGPLPALVWIHGGGYVMGTADGDDLLVKRIVSAVGCAAFSVDYRLAPEFPFPASIEDCYAVLEWVHASAAQLGVDPDRTAIGGSSAGGGLAASLGLLARDRGKVPVAFQLLNVPMLDDRTTVTSEPHPYAGEFVWTPASNLFGWTSLLGGEPGVADVSPYAAAARAESLVGLPSTFIATGALDLFLEEDMEYARRLARSGVPVELHVYPGAFHGFSQAVEAAVTKAAFRDSTAALGRALRPAAQPAPALRRLALSR